MLTQLRNVPRVRTVADFVVEVIAKTRALIEGWGAPRAPARPGSLKQPAK